MIKVLVAEAAPGGSGGAAVAFKQLCAKVQMDWVHVVRNAQGRPVRWQTTGPFINEPLPYFSPERLERARALGTEWLWPVLHGMAARAILRGEDLAAYEAVNRDVGTFIGERVKNIKDAVVSIQDYQCAEMPKWIRKEAPEAWLSFFLHTPFPDIVDDTANVRTMVDIVRGILDNDVVGFQTAQDADNFLDFIEDHMVKRDERTRRRISGPDVKRHPRRGVQLESGRCVSVLVAHIGADIKTWEKMAAAPRELPPEILRKVGGAEILGMAADRLDITKGEIYRLAAYRRLFRDHREYLGRLVFAQAGTHSRHGYQEYEFELKSVTLHWDALKSEFPGKRTIAYLGKKPHGNVPQGNVPQDVLAKLYRRARLMIVNPWRDGWNLTAIEYIICQDMNDPGVLLLSSGAGCYTILRKGVLEVPSLSSPSQLADLIARALEMDLGERRWRMKLLKEAVYGNTLDDWINNFGKAAHIVE